MHAPPVVRHSLTAGLALSKHALRLAGASVCPLIRIWYPIAAISSAPYIRKLAAHCAVTCLVGGWLALSATGWAGSFANFETAPVHPIALSPEGSVLAVCNLPDNRLELFDLRAGLPSLSGEAPVGLDPVAVRFRTTNEIWVVNHISSSISIVDLANRRVIMTLNTLAGPADVVFAGAPQRAFISCARTNAIMVFDPVTRLAITNLAVDGERPKAMAVSPDGSKVYVAIFESGNGTTILGAPIAPFGNEQIVGVVDDASGPYGGQNPPPNRGTGFEPALNPNLDRPPPHVGHIVRKNASGHWLDDNNGDWTQFVSGTNAALSGRVQGWDLPDHDLAIIDTAGFGIRYATGLMNICMDVAVSPVTGRIAVIGTDATNERRFEPNLNGTFLRVNLAIVDPLTLTRTIKDLNPHLNYQTRTLPVVERDKSIGDPRGIVWNSAGTRAYVAGMGSHNLIIIDETGARVGKQSIELGAGPNGLALDEGRHRLYVLNRFAATISVVDTTSETVVTNVPFFDPTPPAVRAGRVHHYDTRKTSGLGHVSCGSCHVDARFDRLAWDLGNPAEMMLTNGAALALASGSAEPIFHPMKGPMVTQTLQDIIDSRPGELQKPLHWRGDRSGIEDFNQTFTNLLANDVALTTNEMKEFKAFLATISFPPNPLRQFNNMLSESVPLPGHFGIGSDGHTPDGSPLPHGNAQNGLNFMRSACNACHVPNQGRAPAETGRDFQAQTGQGQGSFKIAQLRSLIDKTGMDLTRTNSRAGFGFSHDGRADSLSRLLADRFFLGDDDQLLADVIAFLLSFSGSGLEFFGADLSPPSFSLDMPAAVGRQITVTTAGPAPMVDAMIGLAGCLGSRVDIVAKGGKDGLPRGWAYEPGHDYFQSDRNSEHLTLSELIGLAALNNPLTFTVVPEGSGRRIGIDRDEDGYFDRTELDFGANLADSASTPARLLNVTRSNIGVTITWQAVPGKSYRIQFKDNLIDPVWNNLVGAVTIHDSVGESTDTSLGLDHRYYRVQLIE